MRPNKREEILEGARRCFYAHGLAASGVDTIAEEAGVSKRTLYNHFACKDDLVAAYVEWRDARWREVLAWHLDGVTDPIERLLAYVDAYLDETMDPDYRGCPLVNAATEIPDNDSPVLALVRETKERVRTDLLELLMDLGHTDPKDTALAVAAMLEGACALGGIRRERLDARPLKESILALVGVGGDAGRNRAAAP